MDVRVRGGDCGVTEGVVSSRKGFLGCVHAEVVSSEAVVSVVSAPEVTALRPSKTVSSVKRVIYQLSTKLSSFAFLGRGTGAEIPQESLGGEAGLALG